MTLPRVFLRGDDYRTWLEVEGVGKVSNSEDDDFIGPTEVVRHAGLSSLRKALIAWAGATSPPPREFIHPETGEKFLLGAGEFPHRTKVQLVNAAPAKFLERHTYEFMPEPISLVIREGGLLAVEIQFTFEGEQEPDEHRLHRLLAPLLRRAGAKFDGVYLDPHGPIDFRTTRIVTTADFWVVSVYLAVPTHGRRAAEAIDLGYEALLILEAANGGVLTASAARSLLEAGHAELLLGHPEAGWLECKSKPYLTTDEGSFEFAKDVTALANSEGAGILVIGLQTRPVRGRDIVTRVRPFQGDARTADRYRKLLAQRVFPRPVDVDVRAVPMPGGRILLSVWVPPQPPALQPFLVRGIIVGERVSGSHVAVFSRNDDATVVTGAEEIHALLVAGRAALGYAVQGDRAELDHPR